MAEPFDLAVIGAGPAGGAAALEAVARGLSVVLIDEQQAAGGQVWRASSPSILEAPATPEGRAGDALRQALAAAGGGALGGPGGPGSSPGQRDEEGETAPPHRPGPRAGASTAEEERSQAAPGTGGSEDQAPKERWNAADTIPPARQHRIAPDPLGSARSPLKHLTGAFAGRGSPPQAGAMRPPSGRARSSGQVSSIGLTHWTGHRVWSVLRDDDLWVLRTSHAGGLGQVEARALVLATGALERTVPVPGWTLPGVIGLAATTALLKEHWVLPGRRVVVAGCGPLLPYVAQAVLRGGGQVAAVADLNGLADWARAAGPVFSRPDLALRGAGWVARLLGAGVPVLRRTGVRAVEGSEAVEAVRLGPVGPDWAPIPGPERVIEADALCLGHGLRPATEATRMLGARHVWDPPEGGWRPEVDTVGRTSVPFLYATGDGAGIQGAAAAPLRGQAAAVAVAEDLGRAGAGGPAPSAIQRAARFGRAMTALTVPRPGLLAQITPETVVCRCEGLTRARIEAEIAGGATRPGALKSGTRAGMGPCGGRYCADVTEMLAAALTGRPRAEIGQGSGRPPLRPLPLAPVAEGFDYADLPMPAPAPL
ncbi:MAG: NAD(P)/FAD-dependent oxidoreductase [Pseudomonadota bacterium]